MFSDTIDLALHYLRERERPGTILFREDVPKVRKLLQLMFFVRNLNNHDYANFTNLELKALAENETSELLKNFHGINRESEAGAVRTSSTSEVWDHAYQMIVNDLKNADRVKFPAKYVIKMLAMFNRVLHGSDLYEDAYGLGLDAYVKAQYKLR